MAINSRNSWSTHGQNDGIPDIAPTPKPAINLPIVICAREKPVPVCTAQPTVKIAAQKRIEPFRPMRSEVKACASAPTKVLRNVNKPFDVSPMRNTYPADRSDVMIDCRALDKTKPPCPSGSPNLRIKSGIIRHP